MALSGPVLFMRHGATCWTRDDRFQGTINTHLNGEGVRDARANACMVQALIASCRLDGQRCHIVSSPLARARESAGIIAGSLTPEPAIVEDQRLREISMGRWQGLTTWQVKERFNKERKARKHNRFHFAATGGESLAGREADVRSVTETLQPHAIVIAHAGILRLLLHVLGEWDKQQAAAAHVPHVGGFMYHDGALWRVDPHAGETGKITCRVI